MKEQQLMKEFEDNQKPPLQSKEALTFRDSTDAGQQNKMTKRLGAPNQGSVGALETRDRAAETSTQKKPFTERNTLNDLAAREWIPETISVWVQRGLGKNHPDAKIEREHPAPFSFTDVGRLVCFFTKKGQVVLDPFLGIGSTLKACALNARKGIGIELNPRYVALARERLQKELQPHFFIENDQKIIEGDCRQVLDGIPQSSIDFIVTSPPYWCILHKEDHKVKQERKANKLDVQYGDDPRDLGNIEDYEEFLSELLNVFQKCTLILRSGKYMAIVVGDFRNKGKYHMFHADLANRLEKQGLALKGITILYQRHKRIFPYGYPFAFVPNLHHQYILILQKDKPR